MNDINQQLKLSVIIPVYNVEKYLEKCIVSLLDQKYKNIEIILVNDGSIDNSGTILNHWNKVDSRIKVFHKENGGSSSARNYGLEMATGELITFVDSDDWLDENMYNILINNMLKEDADISICGKYKVYGEKYELDGVLENVYEVYDSEQAFEKVNTMGYFTVGMWDKVYRRELFNNLKFPVGVINEDYEITYDLIEKSNVLVYDSKPLYYYRQQISSVTHSGKIGWNAVTATENMMKLLQTKYPKIINYGIFGYILASMGVYDTLITNTDKKIEIRDKKWMLSFRKFIRKNIIKMLSMSSIPKMRKSQMILLAYFPIIYNFIFKRYKMRKIRKVVLYEN